MAIEKELLDRLLAGEKTKSADKVWLYPAIRPYRPVRSGTSILAQMAPTLSKQPLTFQSFHAEQLAAAAYCLRWRMIHRGKEWIALTLVGHNGRRSDGVYSGAHSSNRHTQITATRTNGQANHTPAMISK